MKLKIVAAIVDTKQLTLYKEDGETLIIKQGDPRLRQILDVATPQIIKQGWAEIELEAIITGFQQFEKQSGVVRFFKVARDKLANLFAPAVEEGAVGKVPSEASAPSAELSRTEAAVAEILQHATPVSAPDFDTNNVSQQGNVVEEAGHTDDQRHEPPRGSHTIVAVVGNKVIPDMERIESQFARAAKLGSTKGVEAFLQRLAGVIDQRSHSIEDLLKFMERADTQIADDGSLVIYKVLEKVEGEPGYFVDLHSRKVKQRVGSYVCMDISLVDRDRNNECSNGLHVARRGYINGFSGNACVIAKLAPEDVITVPTYDANKMRVMGYHILAELPPDLHNLLKKNKPITETDVGKTILGNVLAGNHVARLEEVRITQQRGGGLVVTPLDQPVPLSPKLKAKPRPPKLKKLKAEALANPKQEQQEAPLDPKDVAKKVQGLSRRDQALKLLKAYQKAPTEKNKAKLIAHKKACKLGWGALGIDNPRELGLTD